MVGSNSFLALPTMLINLTAWKSLKQRSHFTPMRYSQILGSLASINLASGTKQFFAVPFSRIKTSSMVCCIVRTSVLSSQPLFKCKLCFAAK